MHAPSHEAPRLFLHDAAKGRYDLSTFCEALNVTVVIEMPLLTHPTASQQDVFSTSTTRRRRSLSSPAAAS